MGQGTPGEDTGMWMWMGQETSPRVKTNPQKSSVWELAHGENGIVPPHTKLLSAVFPGTAEVHGVVELRTSKGRFWGWETLIYGMRDGGMC